MLNFFNNYTKADIFMLHENEKLQASEREENQEKHEEK